MVNPQPVGEQAVAVVDCAVGGVDDKAGGQVVMAAPWGQGFPAPLFDGDFTVLGYRVVGEKHLKMTLQPAQGSCQIDAIAFNTAALPDDCQHVHMAYRLDANEFRGIVSPQLIVEYIEPLTRPRIKLPPPTGD